jgi:hypothetical protein
VDFVARRRRGPAALSRRRPHTGRARPLKQVRHRRVAAFASNSKSVTARSVFCDEAVFSNNGKDCVSVQACHSEGAWLSSAELERPKSLPGNFGVTLHRRKSIGGLRSMPLARMTSPLNAYEATKRSKRGSTRFLLDKRADDSHFHLEAKNGDVRQMGTGKIVV